MPHPRFDAMIAAIERQPALTTGQFIDFTDRPCAVGALALHAGVSHQWIYSRSITHTIAHVATQYNVSTGFVLRLTAFNDIFAPTHPRRLSIKDAVLDFLRFLRDQWQAEYRAEDQPSLDAVDAWLLRNIKEFTCREYASVHVDFSPINDPLPMLGTIALEPKPLDDAAAAYGIYKLVAEATLAKLTEALKAPVPCMTFDSLAELPSPETFKPFKIVKHRAPAASMVLGMDYKALYGGKSSAADDAAIKELIDAANAVPVTA